MPKSSEKIFGQLGTPPGSFKDIGRNKIKPGQKIKKPVPLFPKLSNDDIERLREITSRVTEDIFGSKIVLKTARVIDAENIQGSDKLLKLGVDVGGVKKQIVAGIAEHYKPGELVGRTVVIVDNLEHAVIRGEKSEGMLLVAGEGKKISLVTPDRESRSGIQIQ
ncbi:MAG: methionine--tRNA ligase, partial [Candidatus Hydrothermarchaeaceae archaeon]